MARFQGCIWSFCIPAKLFKCDWGQSDNLFQSLQHRGQRLGVFGAEKLQVIDQFVKLIDWLAEVVIFAGQAMDRLIGTHEGRRGGTEKLEVGELRFGVGIFAKRIDQAANPPLAVMVRGRQDIARP